MLEGEWTPGVLQRLPHARRGRIAGHRGPIAERGQRQPALDRVGVGIAVDERREYQVPTAYLLNTGAEVVTGDPSSWYYNTPTSSYYWFWRSSAEVTGTPGYWIEQSFVVAETALFDNRSDRLLWTAKSETMDDERFQRTSASIVRAVARELFAADLLAAMAATPAQRAESPARAERG